MMGISKLATVADDLVEKAVEKVHRQKPGWQAGLDIHLQKHGFKTVMSKLHHFGPLRIQRPFYPEGHTSHIYMLHPPGGVVGGDGLSIHIHSSDSAHGLLTTPGATKFYRSAGAVAKVSQQLSVTKGAVLEWFPQENIFFPGAKVSLMTEINLEEGAHFMGWEISCLGRPANNETFEQGSIDAGFRINRDGKPLLIERLLVDHPRHLNATAGLRNYPMQGVFVAVGVNDTLLNQVREVLDQTQRDQQYDMAIGITLLEDLLVMRVLGVSTEKMQSLMIPVWKLLREQILHKKAVVPRIWNT